MKNPWNLLSAAFRYLNVSEGNQQKVEKALASQPTVYRLSLAGLVGLIVAYCFLAMIVPLLVGLAADTMPALKVLLQLQKPFLLGFSLLLALWARRDPASLAVIFPAASVVVAIFLVVVPSLVIGIALAAAIVGINLSSWTSDWMFAAIPISPLVLINIPIVLLLAATAWGLKQNRILKQWEVFVMLLAASWLGLAIGWSIGS